MKVKVIGKGFKIKQLDIKGKTKKTSNIFEAFKYMGLGYNIIAPILLGLALGIYLEKKFKLNNAILLLIFLGFIVSLYNLFRLNNFKE